MNQKAKHSIIIVSLCVEAVIMLRNPVGITDILRKVSVDLTQTLTNPNFIVHLSMGSLAN